MTHDDKLKAALAKMLPDTLLLTDHEGLKWIRGGDKFNTYGSIQDTELLHVCHLIEQGLSDDDHYNFRVELWALTEAPGELANRNYPSATWQQRTIALAKVKGIEL